MMQDELSEWKDFQAMSTIVILMANVCQWKKLVIQDEGGYIYYPEVQ
jgi:hypothetical protein